MDSGLITEPSCLYLEFILGDASVGNPFVALFPVVGSLERGSRSLRREPLMVTAPSQAEFVRGSVPPERSRTGASGTVATVNVVSGAG